MNDFIQNLNFFVLLKKLNLTKILYIFGNFERTENADHILEIGGLGLFCDYRFINHTCIFVKLD